MAPPTNADAPGDAPDWYKPLDATWALARVQLDAEVTRAAWADAEQEVRAHANKQDDTRTLAILRRREFVKVVAGKHLHAQILDALTSASSRDHLRALRAELDETVVVRVDDPAGCWFDPQGWMLRFPKPVNTALFFQAAAELLVRQEQKLSRLKTDPLTIARMISNNLAHLN